MPTYSVDGVEPVRAHESWIAPSADIIGKVRLLQFASVWFGAVVRGDNEWITIGEHSNVQDSCVLHTDIGAPITIGNYCTIGHKAILHGCTIGDNSLVGMGAVVLNHAVIGKNCLIGAATLIPEGKIIADNSLVVGAPGRVIRILDEEAVHKLKKSAENYVLNWQRFKTSMV
jgi:carbonic anhydrase/acetyltransferase-like protein (isoleucine patch superfamily)